MPSLRTRRLLSIRKHGYEETAQREVIAPRSHSRQVDERGLKPISCALGQAFLYGYTKPRLLRHRALSPDRTGTPFDCLSFSHFARAGEPWQNSGDRLVRAPSLVLQGASTTPHQYRQAVQVH